MEIKDSMQQVKLGHTKHSLAAHRVKELIAPAFMQPQLQCCMPVCVPERKKSIKILEKDSARFRGQDLGGLAEDTRFAQFREGDAEE